jgi:DNA-binding CsgD family transcriptional regulator
MQRYEPGEVVVMSASKAAGSKADAFDEALMLVTRQGTIIGATELACQLLVQHCALKRGANRLPIELRRWLASPQGKRGQCRPFTTQNDEAQLMVTLLHPEADNSFALLLEKRQLSASRPRLRHFGLTVRETEVLAGLGEGKTNFQIAKTFGISESTIKRHVEHILDKFGVDNRAAAVARARELGKPFGGK